MRSEAVWIFGAGMRVAFDRSVPGEIRYAVSPDTHPPLAVSPIFAMS